MHTMINCSNGLEEHSLWICCLIYWLLYSNVDSIFKPKILNVLTMHMWTHTVFDVITLIVYIKFCHLTDFNGLFNNGECNYICINLLGSFECSCNKSYTLAPNNKTCIFSTSDCVYVLREQSVHITTYRFPNLRYASNSSCTLVIDYQHSKHWADIWWNGY